MLKLTSSLRRVLKAQAHNLNPVIMIGNAGLTDAVLKETDVNLDAHGLIKIRVFSDDRLKRARILQKICSQLDAAPIQHIGKLLVIYRPKKDHEKNILESGNNGQRTVAPFKSGFVSARKHIKKISIKSNERITQGAFVKRRKLHQASAKKKALSH